MATSKALTSMYKHTQASASAEWQVNHSLGGYPIIDVFVEHQGSTQRIMPKRIVYNSENTCTVWFSETFTGYAIVS